MICKKTRMVDRDKNLLGERIWIWCPGCEEAHALNVSSTKGEPVWKWNGSLEAPSFFPSLLAVSGKRCHSFISDGTIKFLKDCDHDLAGKTVALPELPDWLANE